MSRVCSLEELASEGALAIVSPHPDDETLGCGGLISLAGRAGRKVLVVQMTDGSASHTGSRRWSAARLAWLRTQEANAALAVLSRQTVTVTTLGIADGRLEDVDPVLLATTLEGLFRLHDVATVLSPRWDDTHPDHRAAFRAAQTAAERLDARLWCYPIWRDATVADDDTGLVRLDISSVLPLKRRAIARHRSQISSLIADAETSFRLKRSNLKRFLECTESYFEFQSFRVE